jgi:hypothetical protein
MSSFARFRREGNPLQAKLEARSKVDVVRRGLRLLRDVTEWEALREACRRASRATRASLGRELEETDHLAESLSELRGLVEKRQRLGELE